jgi:hypothetical protein
VMADLHALSAWLDGLKPDLGTPVETDADRNARKEPKAPTPPTRTPILGALSVASGPRRAEATGRSGGQSALQ